MADLPLRSLLLLDADAGERRLLTALAGRAGWSVESAQNVDQGVAALLGAHGGQIRAVVLAHWATNGGDAIAALRAARDGLPIIVLADRGETGLATQALRAGASDYLTRPIAPERLIDALATHADRRRGGGELAPMSEKQLPFLRLDELVGAAPDFRAALAVAAKAARHRSGLLIVGEPGTGKESVARAVHAASPRDRAPLVMVDCRAVPGNLVDSELFGHVAGAFPGAFADRVGRLVEAHGGTLLLDNIDALPPATQARLEATLASGEVRPLGCNGSSSVDVRLMGTTTEALPETFDAALAARVSATSVTLPALRDRSADIPALARHLLTRLADQPGMQATSIGNDALAVLMRYGWPGNVRQLASVLFRAGLTAKSATLTADDLPHIAIQSRFTGRRTDVGATAAARTPSAALLSGNAQLTLFRPDGHLRSLDDIEADIIRLAIGHYRGRMTEVARRLGIGRSTLYRKLGELGIDTAA